MGKRGPPVATPPPPLVKYPVRQKPPRGQMEERGERGGTEKERKRERVRGGEREREGEGENINRWKIN